MKHEENGGKLHKNEESITEENDTFANGAVAIVFDKFYDTEKWIISIAKLENVLDEIKENFHGDEFDSQVLNHQP